MVDRGGGGREVDRELWRERLLKVESEVEDGDEWERREERERVVGEDAPRRGSGDERR